MTYATRWARCWSLVGAVGVGLSFLVWRPVSVVTVFATAALCAGVVLALLAPAARPQSRMTAVRWSRVAVQAGLVGAGVVAVGGYSAVLPALAIPLVLAAAVSHPWCVDSVRAWRSQHLPSRPSGGGPPVRDTAGGLRTPEPAEGVAVLPTRAAPVDQQPEVTASAVQGLSDQELCRAWRHSFVTLQSCRSAHERARVVALRQVYLDEMERRSPSGLRAWLESGARAAGGPERFLGKRPDDQTDAA